MPKIDWFDDELDQPRWEPRRRIDRMARIWTSPLARERRQPIPPPSLQQSDLPTQGTRRPLHLIWGPPQQRMPE